jgi:hypothetical protein
MLGTSFRGTALLLCTGPELRKNHPARDRQANRTTTSPDTASNLDFDDIAFPAARPTTASDHHIVDPEHHWGRADRP